MAGPSASSENLNATAPPAAASAPPPVGAVAPPTCIPPGVKYSIQNHQDGGYSYQYHYQTSAAAPIGYTTTRTSRTYTPAPVMTSYSVGPAVQIATTKTSTNAPPATKQQPMVQRTDSRGGMGSNFSFLNSNWNPETIQKYIRDHFTMPTLYDFGYACPVDQLLEVQPHESHAKQITFRPATDAMFDPISRVIIICMDLPGFVKSEVCIEIDNFELSVSGKRDESERQVKYGNQLNMFMRETHYGYFYRSFKLPPNALEDSVAASMENGRLEVKIQCLAAGEKKMVAVS